MKELLSSSILLIIGLSVFFNTERLDLTTVDTINIDTIVYVLGLGAVLAIIGFSWMRRLSLVKLFLVWTTIYLICKSALWFFADGRSIVGDVLTYLSLAELFLLLMLVWLAKRFANAMTEFEDAIEKITFTHLNGRIKQISEADDDIQSEMFRSRHHHHPLSIVIVEPEAEAFQSTWHQAVREVQQKMVTSYIINTMAQTLSKYLRRTDLILEQRDQGRFLILCPDTNTTDLKLLVEYIKSITTEKLGTSVICGVATFPDEAITFEELVNRAESHLRPPNLNGRVQRQVDIE